MGAYYNCTGGAAAYIDRTVLTDKHIYGNPTPKVCIICILYYNRFTNIMHVHVDTFCSHQLNQARVLFLNLFFNKILNLKCPLGGREKFS